MLLRKVSETALIKAGLYPVFWTGNRLLRSHLPAGRRWRAEAADFYRRIVGPNALVFDIGANIGSYTEVFASLGAHVVAVEPHPWLVRHLKWRFGRDNRIKVVRRAVDAQRGSIDLWMSDRAPSVSTVSDEWRNDSRFAGVAGWNRRCAVPATTLDDLIRHFGLPDYCKIDVEGHELSLFRGLSAKLPLVSFEFTVERLPVASACLDLLADHGAQWFNLETGDSLRWQRAAWINRQELDATLRDLAWDGLFGEIFAATDVPSPWQEGGRTVAS